MLDLKFLQQQPEQVQEGLDKRKSDLLMSDFLALDSQRKDLIQQVEELRRVRNQASDAVAELKKQGADAQSQIAELSHVAKKIKDLDVQKKTIETQLLDFRLAVPNIPHPDVPPGDSDEDNRDRKSVV